MFKWIKRKIRERREKKAIESFMKLIALMEKAEREYIENYPFKEFL